MNKKNVLVVYSGGQDSTTCLYQAIHNYGTGNVTAVGFDYGQRHLKELEIARQICDSLAVSYTILKLPVLNELAPNSLTRSEIPVDSADYQGSTPNTFVAGRNHLFLSYAAIYAMQLGIRDIVTGVCQTDFSGYPDCRDSFIKSLNVTLNLAMDYDFNIITPLMWLDKMQTWALADELGCLDVIKEKTLTCYNAIPGDGCGTCPACTLRRKGYEAYLKGIKHDERK